MSAVTQLNITCGASDCEHGRHAFNNPHRAYKRRGSGRNFLQPGVCKACGAAPVDWQRLHARDPNDIANTFESLRFELIRWEFWNRPFSERSLLDLNRRGHKAVFEDVRPTLVRFLKPVANAGWQFQQVPIDQEKMQNVFQYAQHAVAACCRRCVEIWHGLPNDRPLSDGEIDYLALLVQCWLRIAIHKQPVLHPCDFLWY